MSAPLPETIAELRMDAYYYGFDRTGVPEIDRILSAVACAGKAFHHTESWTDEVHASFGHAGNSPVEWIQNAANDAARSLTAAARVVESEAEIAALRAENERLRRVATDRNYMLEAYFAMLGPKGRAVAEAWQAKGVQRFHVSWGPDAAAMSGEERAQVILDFENAPRTLIDNIDGPSSGRPRIDLRQLVNSLTPPPGDPS